jgi:diguanylate cyclase (GGDEF)-like protein/PAS domain S-box-containing protein
MNIPHPFRNRSIRFKLVLASTAVQVVLLSLLLINSVRLMDQAAHANLDTLISQNASMLHAMATAYSGQANFGPLQDTLGELLADNAEGGLVYVRIADENGKILLRAGLPQMDTLPDPSLGFGNREAVNLLSSPVIHVRHHLLLTHNKVGLLQFGVSASVLIAARQAIITQGSLIALAEVLTTVILLSSIAYLLTTRLAQLVDSSQALADGKLDHRLNDEGGDELARLARHFNIMAAALQQRVTELQDFTTRLKSSEERYALAIRGANDGLWDWDVPDDCGHYSPRFCELLGITVDDSVSDDSPLQAASTLFTSRLHPDEAHIFKARMAEHLKGSSPQFMLEHRIRHEDGGYRWIMTRGVAQRNASGWAVRMAGSISDIHLRKRAEQQLLYDALHDVLTGLANRALFIEHVRQALSQQRGGEHSRFAILTINLERFHLINDSYGHATGDKLLRVVADHIANLLRPGDIVARIGGDQFTVLLHGVGTSDDAIDIARSLITLPGFTPPGTHQMLHMKCRIGITISENAQSDAETLLRDTDNALQMARKSGASPIEVFQSSMHDQVLNTLRIETDLRNALSEQQLHVHYQPIVRLSNREISSFEALVRWPHSSYGMISPAKFIPIAESLDLIHELGMFVLRRTCEDITDWQTQTGSEPPPVSVNLSARQLSRLDLVEEILGIISSYQLAPERLRFEVTESLLTSSTGPAGDTLQRLRDAGMIVLIDDFGTGYSALSYLHTIPCDVVKLDGSFVGTVTTDSRLRAIVRRSISLAHDLGMLVIAECIEKEEQARMLGSIGCDFGQGYLFSRPVAATEVSALIKAQRLSKRQEQ